MGRPTRSDRKPKSEDGDKDVQEAAAFAIEAIAHQEPQSQTEIDWVCLMARGEECTSRFGLEKHKDAWRIDSAATSHMTFNRSLFSSYQSAPPFPVQMGDSFTALAVEGEISSLTFSRIAKWRHLNSATCSMYFHSYTP